MNGINLHRDVEGKRNFNNGSGDVVGLQPACIAVVTLKALLYIYSDSISSERLSLTISWLELAFPVVSWKYCHPRMRSRKRGSMKSSQFHTVTRKI